MADIGTDMLASTIIIMVSIALFVYWFRYSCMLILNTKTIQSYAAEVARSKELRFLKVQATLEGGESAALSELHVDLERDYDRISGLLSGGVGRRGGDHADGYILERAMLGMSFHWLSLQYRLVSGYSEKMARAALLDMSRIVEHHANAFGEALAAQRC